MSNTNILAVLQERCKELQFQNEVHELELEYFGDFINSSAIVTRLFLEWANPSQVGKEHLPAPF